MLSWLRSLYRWILRIQRAVSFGVSCRKAEGRARGASTAPKSWDSVVEAAWKRWVVVEPVAESRVSRLGLTAGTALSSEVLKRHVLGAAKEKAASKAASSSTVPKAGFGIWSCGRGGGSTLFSFWGPTGTKFKFTGHIYLVFGMQLFDLG